MKSKRVLIDAVVIKRFNRYCSQSGGNPQAILSEIVDMWIDEQELDDNEHVSLEEIYLQSVSGKKPTGKLIPMTRN